MPDDDVHRCVRCAPESEKGGGLDCADLGSPQSCVFGMYQVISATTANAQGWEQPYHASAQSPKKTVAKLLFFAPAQSPECYAQHSRIITHHNLKNPQIAALASADTTCSMLRSTCVSSWPAQPTVHNLRMYTCITTPSHADGPVLPFSYCKALCSTPVLPFSCCTALCSTAAAVLWQYQRGHAATFT